MSKPKSPKKNVVLKLNQYSVIKAAEYPLDWKFLLLGDPQSGIFSNGVNKNAKDYGHGCLFVNISDVFRDFMIDPKKLGRVEVTEEEIKNYKLEKGDLVLDRSSNIFETVGYPTYFDGYNEPIVFSGFTFRYRPNKTNWNPKFLTYQLMSYPIRKLITSISTKSANSNVNQKSYKKIQVPCPPLREQQKITSIISNVGNLIDQTQKIIEQTNKLKKGLMHTIFTKGINNTKPKKTKSFFGKYEEIPDDWNFHEIESVATPSAGGTPSRFNEKYWKNGTIPWLSSGEIKNNRINDSSEKITALGLKESAAKLFPKGTVLIAITGFGTTRGKSSLLEIDASTNQSVIGIIAKKNILNNEFLWYYLQKQYWILRNFAQGSQQPGLNLDIVKKFRVLVPSDINEQEKIASIFSNVDSKIQQEQSYKSKLEILKKELMEKLLTGQIRVKI